MLIIFDFDGVLYSASWEKLFEGYRVLLDAFDKDYKLFFKDASEFKRFWDPNWRLNYEKLGIEDSVVANQIFYKTYNHGLCVFPWVKKMIFSLSPQCDLAMLTSRSRSEVEKLMGALAIYFWPLIGGDSVLKLKPDPEGVNLILLKTKIPKEECLIIGDMDVDVAAGKAAGIKTGIVKWGLDGNDKERWEATLTLKPDYIFKNPALR